MNPFETCIVAPPEEFESPTFGLGSRCSIQLSYGGKWLIFHTMLPFLCHVIFRVGHETALPISHGDELALKSEGFASLIPCKNQHS